MIASGRRTAYRAAAGAVLAALAACDDRAGEHHAAGRRALDAGDTSTALRELSGAEAAWGGDRQDHLDDPRFRSLQLDLARALVPTDEDEACLRFLDAATWEPDWLGFDEYDAFAARLDPVAAIELLEFAGAARGAEFRERARERVVELRSEIALLSTDCWFDY